MAIMAGSAGEIGMPIFLPAFIRSDNGPEFVAQDVRDWIAAVGAKTAYIVPGSPWENGYCESFSPFSRMIDSSFAFGDSLLIWNMIHLLV
jgi:transposase InsO family protein